MLLEETACTVQVQCTWAIAHACKLAVNHLPALQRQPCIILSLKGAYFKHFSVFWTLTSGEIEHCGITEKE